MRYQPTHAAPRERVPFALWGPTPLRGLLSAAVASAAALVPCVMVGSPAQAASSVLAIANASAVEGNAVTFTLKYTGSGPADYDLTLGGGSATAVTDYATTVNNTTVSFSAAGEQTVTVDTESDVTEEQSETFTLTATNDPNSTDNVSATGTITDSWTKFALTSTSPVVETAKTTVTNGNTVVTPAKARVTATLLAPVTHDVEIPVRTFDNETVSNLTGGQAGYNDYTPVTTTLTIPAGQRSVSTDVTINDDDLDEDNYQSFDVAVNGSATGATPVTGGDSLTIQIQDDDATPTVSIGGAGQVVEGSPLGFPLTLSGKSEKEVSVKVTTADGQNTENSYGAKAIDDYDALTNETVTFLPTTTTSTALVTTNDDSAVEASPESLSAAISNPLNATLGTTTTATGGINDNEDAPKVSLTPTSINENGVTPGGERTVDVNVNLDTASSIPVKIDYTFSGGTATAGTDYKGTGGSLTIAPGQQTAKIPVTIVDDGTYETPNETFNVVLTSPNMSVDSATLGAKQITIADNETAPTFTIADFDIAEGDSGTKMAKMPVTLSGPVSADVRIGVTLTDDTAVSTGLSTGTTVGDDDYEQPANSYLTVAAGSTTGYIEIPINSDLVFEKNELINVAVSQGAETRVSNATPTGVSHAAKFTINNEDVAPKVAFNESSGTEGTTLRVIGTVTGVAQSNIPLTFTYSGIGDHPVSSGDYDNASPQTAFTINRGVTGTQTLANIFLNQDTIDEAQESIGVTAKETSPSNVGFVTTTGVYKVNDDPGDLPPTVRITDESIKEDLGSVDLGVILDFTGDTTETEQAVTVPWSTMNGSAIAGQDYVEKSDTVYIAPGDLTGVIKVEILNDKRYEYDEDFFVKLGTPGPAGATLGKSIGEVTIESEDDATAPTISTPASIKGAGPVWVTGTAAPGATVELWVGKFGSTGLTKANQTTANNNGMYTFSRTITAATRFAVRSEDLNSAERTVRVQQVPALSASSASTGRVNFTVTAKPRLAGQAVTVQRQNANGSWSTVARGTTNSSGAYSASVSKYRSGTSWTFRAYVGADTDAGTLGGYSVAKRVRVR